jgi:putative ABC transport system permease protein
VRGVFRLVLSAVRARRPQVLTVLVLTALAAAVAAAGPWYGLAAGRRAAAADVAAAPAGQRTLSVRQQVATDGDPQTAVDTFAATARSVLPISDSTPTLGVTQAMSVSRNGENTSMPVAFRDDFCGHVRLDGTCPAAAGEAAINLNAAQQLGLAVGDRLTVQAAPATEPVRLRITARYEITDPYGAYWSNPLFRADDELDPVFTPLATFTDEQLRNPTLAYDIDVPEALLRGDGGYRLRPLLRAAEAEFLRRQIRLVDPTAQILATVGRDRDDIERGVVIVLIQVLLLAWFAIGLAGRYTGRDRHADIALLKLRGSGRLGMLRLTLGQHLIPMVGGLLIGVPLGLLAARALGGPVTGDERSAALAQSAGVVGAVLAGGLLVLAAVEAAVLRRPVAALLRQVPAGRRDWRADIVDLALLAVAVAGIYQARYGGRDTGLGLVAPALVALAVALLTARLLGRLADRAGAVALRRGRLRFGLTAVQVSRQPGTDRVFALVVVAVAMFVTAAGGWSGTRTANAVRAEAELGAARVLTVQAANRVALLHAVRQADPGGRTAMAAVVDVAAQPPILAVDTDRLAAVARWRPEYGPAGALGDALAGARLPAPLPAVTGTRLTLRVVNATPVPMLVTAALQNRASGAAVPVTFGPIGRGDRTVSAPVTGCAGPASGGGPGCRFVRWELSTPAAGGSEPGPPPDTGSVTVRSLAQQDPPTVVLGPEALGDVARWRSGIAGLGLDLTAADDRLSMAAEPEVLNLQSNDNQAFAIDAVLPLPLVLAGPPPAPWRFTDPVLYPGGDAATPVRVAGTASALPVLGSAGVLVDLESTARLAADTDLGGTAQVWLTAGAPASIVDALTADGLTVTADESATARADRLAAQGPSVSTRFALLAAIAALLLAAATVAVAVAVDRDAQIGRLQALRLQGLPAPVARTTAYAGPAAVLVAGLLGGVLAATAAGPLVRVSVPPFIDGWQVIPPPAALGGGVLATAAATALAVLMLAGGLSVLPLLRRLPDRPDAGGDR